MARPFQCLDSGAVLQVIDPLKVGIPLLAPTGQALQTRRSPTELSMDAVIYPRPYLPPDDAQRLGQAIEAILAETGSEEAPGFTGFGISSVGDLLAREVPKPLIMSCLIVYRKLKERFGETDGIEEPMATHMIPEDLLRKHLVNDVPVDIHAPAVLLQLGQRLGDDHEAAEQLLVDRLPGELVERVQVFPASWRPPGEGSGAVD